MDHKYSVCMINKNNMPIIREAMEILLAQVDRNYNVVVVDSMSTDGAKEYLDRLSKSGVITLIEEECSRGRGRQIGFERSSGSYIIGDIETDDLLIPSVIPRVVAFCHANFEGKLMTMKGFSIAPREVYAALGGWKDLQWDEESYVWYLASTKGLLVHIPFETRAKVMVRRRSNLRQMRWRYIRARERLRIGASPVSGVRLSRYPVHVAITAVAWVRSRFMERYSPKLDPDFDLLNYVPKDIFPSIEEGPGKTIISKS
jgi:glycosyltransferase involved in cell wall biosynthesis